MPLYSNARDLIRRNLEQIGEGRKVRLIPIAVLTAMQLDALNMDHLARGLDLMFAEVIFLGRHVYKSRVAGDGYTIDDVLDQISSAFDPAAELISSQYMTALQNPNPRADRYGNRVRDRAILECAARHPRPELFSIIPKGDQIKPLK
jgi:hypothetical protein